MKHILTIGFKQSIIDNCILYQGRTIFSCCVENVITSSSCNIEIYKVINNFQT